MSSATDKARFYLEKSVPELKEYERKKIFNKVHPTGPPRTKKEVS
jgi:U3 small nucleolar RNA-associated protein 6